MKNALKILNRSDAVYLLELIQSSSSCQTEEDLREVVLKLQSLIPFDYAACGLAKMKAGSEIELSAVLNISFPKGWLDIYWGERLYEIDPVFRRNFAEFTVQYWTETYKVNAPSEEIVRLKNDFGLGDGCTHGAKNHKKTQGSMFSLSCKSPSCKSAAPCKSSAFQSRVEAILVHIIPHMHNALCRVAGQSAKNQARTLSAKELEVLNWIKEGKRSWDISTILGVSERTVNFHATNIMQKLDAVSRPQAIANAISWGLIDID